MYVHHAHNDILFPVGFCRRTVSHGCTRITTDDLRFRCGLASAVATSSIVPAALRIVSGERFRSNILRLCRFDVNESLGSVLFTGHLVHPPRVVRFTLRTLTTVRGGGRSLGLNKK